MKRFSIAICLLLCPLVAVGTAGTASAATDVFIKFEGIDGEARDHDHEGWIELVAFSAPAGMTGTAPRADRQRGDVVVEDLRVSKQADKASPKLSEAVCKGRVIPKVEIHVTATYADGSPPAYYAYELTNVRVMSYSVHAPGPGSADTVPREEIALNFEEVKVDYSTAKSKGKGKVESTWKVEEGEK